jgi:hypothetical protein
MGGGGGGVWLEVYIFKIKGINGINSQIVDVLTSNAKRHSISFHARNCCVNHMLQPHFGAKCENATHTPKSGKWSPPKIQKMI